MCHQSGDLLSISPMLELIISFMFSTIYQIYSNSVRSYHEFPYQLYILLLDFSFWFVLNMELLSLCISSHALVNPSVCDLSGLLVVNSACQDPCTCFLKAFIFTTSTISKQLISLKLLALLPIMSIVFCLVWVYSSSKALLKLPPQPPI